LVLEYKRLKKDRRQLLALTGLTHKEFVALHEAFCVVYATVSPGDQTAEGRARKRRSGGGRKGRLGTTEQKLLFSLVYLKTDPLQALLGELFGLSQSRANRWLQRLLPIVKQALEELGVLPSREPEQFAEQERDHQEAAALIIDGTDRRRHRPKNKEKQALHYSGKHKTHSDKNVVVVNAKTKRVGYLSQTYAGRMHDKKIVDSEPIRYPAGTILYKDTGFQGYEPKVQQSQQPKKSRARAC
jgi:Helix-turn-helix of DDE superfamily endonuclease/DDE superfamily endonuclease